ncbi:MAG: hypothetical protein M1829_001718 [Trizodia sp. TS-e1964]|nr:MAG: hypothetical protein M1829_001718 [Trizodia sp. TS-e1964]
MPESATTPQGSFSYEGDTLFVKVGGHNLHRRATITEIQELLHPSTQQLSSDRVGHWYEAQCVHYGLQPSKTKSVAKTRLLDALNSKSLEVPKAIRQIEDKLRKQWHKSEKEKLTAQKKAATPSTAEVSSRKRKATASSLDMESPRRKKTAVKNGKSVNPNSLPSAEEPRPVPVPSKATNLGRHTRPGLSQQPAKRGRGGTTRARGGRAGALVAPADMVVESQVCTKQTARRGREFPGPMRNTAITETRPNRPKQTARCSRGRPGSALRASRPENFGNAVHQSEGHDSDVSMPDAGDSQYSQECSDLDAEEEHNEPAQGNGPPLYEDEDICPTGGRLGLLNGEYEISCAGLQNEWSEYDDYEFSLTLTLQGDLLWGAYDFGMFSGILRIPQRPYEASDTPYELNWRGVENSESVISYDDSRQRGWIKFLGDGKIFGNLIGLYGEHQLFKGVRVSGSNTTSARNARSMKEEWDTYTKAAYEEARIRRWH